MASETARQKKARHREEAEARQAVYDSLTREEKLERIEARPGESRRERERIG